MSETASSEYNAKTHLLEREECHFCASGRDRERKRENGVRCSVIIAAREVPIARFHDLRGVTDPEWTKVWCFSWFSSCPFA